MQTKFELFKQILERFFSQRSLVFAQSYVLLIKKQIQSENSSQNSSKSRGIKNYNLNGNYT